MGSVLVVEHGRARLLRSDRDGWIELTTDGERMWVEVERTQDIVSPIESSSAALSRDDLMANRYASSSGVLPLHLPAERSP